MTRKLFIAFAAVLMLSSTVYVSAGVFKWVDENGRVHYSDKPVGDKAETLDIQTAPVAPASQQSDADRKLKVEQYLRARELERAEIDRKQKEKKRLAKERAEKCGEAKHEYQELIEAGSVYYKNKDGTRDYLEPGRRKKAEAAAKAEVKKWCK